jgi:ribulose-phosphate 3-epimerase
MTIRIAPSVLSCDLGRLAEQVAAAQEGGADWLHVDVMDGHFVPNLTFGAPLVKALRRLSTLPLDVHLMVEQPEKYIAEYADLGVQVFTFHPEATRHVQRQLAAIRERGMQAGLSLNPGTPLSYLEEVVDDVDLVLLMSVNPGYGGQAFIPQSGAKLQRIRRLLDARRSGALFLFNDAATTETIGAAWAAGADTFVAGTAVFGTADPAAAIRALRARCAVRV